MINGAKIKIRGTSIKEGEMKVLYNVVLDEVIYVEEKDYQRIKKNLNKDDDYFDSQEVKSCI